MKGQTQMNRSRKAVLFSLVAVVVLALWLQTRVFAAGVADQLIGSWSLVSRQTTLADGKVISDPGLSANPKGVLIYDRSGHVAAQLSRPGRTVSMLTSECGEVAKIKGTNDTAQTVIGYDAYFGTYTLDIEKGIVTHHLEGAIFPDDVSKSIARHFTISGDTLTITFGTTMRDGTPITRTLVWARMK
jgi:Lipocalin-like domain